MPTLTVGRVAANRRDLATREIDCVVDSSGAQPGLDLATDIVKRAGLINLFGWSKIVILSRIACCPSR